MASRGRPPLGARHADKLVGSEHASERLGLILRTISGELTVAEACARLEVSEAHFHRLRDQALQGALAALEPKPAGRPPERVDPLVEQVAELQRALQDRDIELRASQLREEIAVIMPHLLRPRLSQGKKTPAAKRRRRRHR